MAVSDWQAWAANQERQIAELTKRLALLEKGTSPDISHHLVSILTAVGVVDGKALTLLTGQERQRVLLETLAGSILDEVQLAKFTAKLATGTEELDKVLKSQTSGPE